MSHSLTLILLPNALARMNWQFVKMLVIAMMMTMMIKLILGRGWPNSVITCRHHSLGFPHRKPRNTRFKPPLITDMQ